jgi:predicted nucleotidyltransferase
MNEIKIEFPQYFVTKSGIVAHTITPISVGEDRVVGVPKYFPISKPFLGCRMRGDQPYSDHFPTYSDSVDMIKMTSPSFIRFTEAFGEDMITFPLEEIAEVLDPKKTTCDILATDSNNPVIQDAKRLVELFVETYGFDTDDIGIEGSIMVGCYKSSSDVDLVLYGLNNGRSLVEGFTKLAEKEGIHLYDISDIDLIFSRRFKNRSFDTLDQLLVQEQRRTSGLFNNRRFWLQPLNISDEAKKRISERSMKRIGTYEGVVMVSDASLAPFWPSFYECVNSGGEPVVIEGHDPIYMNQADKGDLVFVRGNLYNDDKGRTIVILAPWTKESPKLQKIGFSR